MGKYPGLHKAEKWKKTFEAKNANVKLKSKYEYHYKGVNWECQPNPPVCQGPAPLWRWFPSLSPGDCITRFDLRIVKQSTPRNRSRFAICRKPLLHWPPPSWINLDEVPIAFELVATFAVISTVAPSRIHGGLRNCLTVPIHRNSPTPTILSLGTLFNICSTIHH